MKESLGPVRRISRGPWSPPHPGLAGDLRGTLALQTKNSDPFPMPACLCPCPGYFCHHLSWCPGVHQYPGGGSGGAVLGPVLRGWSQLGVTFVPPGLPMPERRGLDIYIQEIKIIILIMMKGGLGHRDLASPGTQDPPGLVATLDVHAGPGHPSPHYPWPQTSVILYRV